LEEIVKGIVELCKQNKEIGLLTAAFLLITWFLIRQLVQQMKWREEWLEKFVTALSSNKTAMEEGRGALDDVKTTVAEMDTDVHDMMEQMDRDREVNARVADEIERKSHGRGSR